MAVTDAADEVDAGVDVGFGSEAGTAVPGGGSPGAGVLPEGAAPGQGRRPRSRRAGEEDTGPVLAGAGPATGLLLPGSADMVWKRVPLHLRVTLAGAAYRLVTPEQPVLREKKNREVRFALKAAGSKRATGRHWLVLLSSPRGSFGSARSEKADRVYEVLHQIVAEYVGPAVGNTGNTEAEEPEGVEASGVLLAAGAEGADVSVVLPAARDCVVEGALAADTEAAAAGSVVRQGTSSGEAEPTDTRPAPRVEAAAGAARGLLLPAPHDPSWATVPLPLRQSLRMTAHHLVTPAPRALKTKTHRHVLAAVRAAQRMRMTGAHWLVLLTTERKVFGSPDSTPADAFYGVLEQILAQHPPAQDNQDRREAVPEETGTG
ncbi:hypothetical protein [Streptomyces anthocyanicus]|uniref:hypothetical protein n=1 Tax=Streptomyces anthocyanicus TaxID=68174 RepID=UPI0038040C12